MADRQNLQPAPIIAKLYGSDVRRIQQLNKEGVIKGQGRTAMYDLLPTDRSWKYKLSIQKKIWPQIKNRESSEYVPIAG